MDVLMSLRYVAIPWMLLASVTPTFARQFVFDLTPGLRTVDGRTSGEFDLGLQFSDIQRVRLDIEATHTPGYMVVDESAYGRWQDATTLLFRGGMFGGEPTIGDGFRDFNSLTAEASMTASDVDRVLAELPAEQLTIKIDGKFTPLGLSDLASAAKLGRFVATVENHSLLAYSGRSTSEETYDDAFPHDLPSPPVPGYNVQLDGHFALSFGLLYIAPGEFYELVHPNLEFHSLVLTINGTQEVAEPSAWFHIAALTFALGGFHIGRGWT